MNAEKISDMFTTSVKEHLLNGNKSTNEIIKEDKETSSMIPSFTQCRPIRSPGEIQECLTDPPDWIYRVVPRKKRTGYVIRNTLSDCHLPEEHFFVRGRVDGRMVPKTLVCHDYKGGYLADSYVPFEGSEDKTLATDGYTFYNWAQIDYFVYFSHYFLTIPPLTWVNAGHRNGVKVLGTIITENNDGIQNCNEELFKTREKMREYVYQIVETQKTFGFDGWLLNIENPVQNVGLLKEFVKLLTEETHKQDSEAVIIWYDSVTDDGRLRWQDQLNELNRCFFDNCDGIFLNYSWNEEKLINSVRAAGPRHFDVFVGVDVFGRNFYGGGKFDTYKAIDLIHKHNLSMAIFAPGWTHETIDKTLKEDNFRTFLIRDDAFWISLWPYLYTHPINDFFETDFHVGLDSNYYNLYVQKQQISRMLHPEHLDIIPNHSTIYNLNTCNCVKRGFFESKNVCSLSNSHISDRHMVKFVHRIFACDIKLSGRVGAYFLTKRSSNSDTAVLDVTLLTCLKSGCIRKIRLLGQQKLVPVDNISVMEVNQLADDAIKYNNTLNNIAKKHIKLLSRPRYTGSVLLSMYAFSTSPCDLLEIGATIMNGSSIQILECGIFPL